MRKNTSHCVTFMIKTILKQRNAILPTSFIINSFTVIGRNNVLFASDDDFFTRLDNNNPNDSSTPKKKKKKKNQELKSSSVEKSTVVTDDIPVPSESENSDSDLNATFVEANQVVELFDHLDQVGDTVVEDLAKVHQPEIPGPTWEEINGSDADDQDLVESVETVAADGTRIFSYKEVREQFKAAKKRPLPEIRDEDIEEKFIRGFGRGGQKLNKTSSCIQLKHKPTGIVVKCQKTRSQTTNRSIARKILQLKIDHLKHGVASKLTQKQKKIRKQKAKIKRRQEAKKFGEEVIEDSDPLDPRDIDMDLLEKKNNPVMMPEFYIPGGMNSPLPTDTIHRAEDVSDSESSR